MNNQQAINLLKGLEQSLDDYCGLNDEGKTAFRMAITALELFGNSEHLPSAQPERMRGRLLTEDELRDLSVTLDGLITYLGSIAQDVVGATHYQHRVNEMLIMLMKEGEE